MPDHDALTNQNPAEVQTSLQRTPPEVLSQIFGHCIATEDIDMNVPIPRHSSLTRTLVTLTAVCQFWRDTALSDVTLWTTIRVILQPEMVVAHLDMIRRFLELSGGLLVAFQIVMPQVYDDYMAVFRPMVDILNMHSHRWHVLDLYLPMDLVSALCGGSAGAPHLAAIRILHLKSGSVSGQHDFRVAHGELPSPVVVELSGLPLSSMKINWSNVGYVKIASIHGRECQELFRLATAMISCEIGHVCQCSDIAVTSRAPFVHESVEHLRIVFESPEMEELVLSGLILPKLKVLFYQNDGQYDPLERFIFRSSCPLQELHLWSPRDHSTEKRLVPLLYATPQLKSLSLHHGSGKALKELFQLLAITNVVDKDADTDNGQAVFLPHLSALACIGQTDYPWHYVPSMFPSGKWLPGVANTLCRPLCLIALGVAPDSDTTCQSHVDPHSTNSSFRIAYEIVEELLKSVDRGYDLRICNTGDGKDLVEYSKQYHVNGIGYSDWAMAEE